MERWAECSPFNNSTVCTHTRSIWTRLWGAGITGKCRLLDIQTSISVPLVTFILMSAHTCQNTHPKQPVRHSHCSLLTRECLHLVLTLSHTVLMHTQLLGVSGHQEAQLLPLLISATLLDRLIALISQRKPPPGFHATPSAAVKKLSVNTSNLQSSGVENSVCSGRTVDIEYLTKVSDDWIASCKTNILQDCDSS